MYSLGALSSFFIYILLFTDKKKKTDQLKKDGFHWSNQAKKAFVKLKQAMSSILVLALPDFTQPFILETDASGQGLGAGLTQNSYQGPLIIFL